MYKKAPFLCSSVFNRLLRDLRYRLLRDLRYRLLRDLRYRLLRDLRVGGRVPGAQSL
jgi:predicted DCC family thiol-disulfide oxidoreductase YuxK